MSDSPPSMLAVQVAYALPQRQWLVELSLPAGSTVAEAIERSGLRAELGAFEPGEGDVGVFGQPVALDAALRDGDRVELYRPLQCDPKQVRRERAARQAPRKR